MVFAYCHQTLTCHLTESRSARLKMAAVLYAPFSAVKGCSENGCQAIMRAREKVGGKFESLAQFEEAVEKRACNSRVRESLQKVGAFASIEP